MKSVVWILLSIAFAQQLFGFHNSKSNSFNQDTIIQFNEVVVTATRQITRKFDLPESISVLSDSSLSMLTPMSTADAISSLPGVWMQKTNHAGGSPFIRGLTGYQTLILIDGIRFNNSTFRSGPNQYLNTIDPYVIDRVEVLKGGGAVQYGSDAIGGTLNILTKKPSFENEEKNRITSKAQTKIMSSDMEYSGRLETEHASQKTWIHLGLSVKKIGDIRAGGNLGILNPTGYNEISADLKLAKKIGKKSLLTAGLQYLRQSQVPLYHEINNNKFITYLFDPQQRYFSYLKFNKSYASKFVSRIKWMISYQEGLEQRIKQRSIVSDLLKDRDKVHTLGTSVELISQPRKFWNVSSSIELYHDLVNSNTEITKFQTESKLNVRGLYPNNSRYTNYALSSIHRFTLQSLTISAGLRYNIIQIDVQDSLFGATKLWPSALVGNFGVVYSLHPNLHLVASIGSAFRAPNINDVSSFGMADFRYEIPNFGLKPERSIHADVGIKAKFDNSEFSLHNYLIKINGLIANEPYNYNGLDSIEGLQVYHKNNINVAILKGLEAEGKFRLAAKCSVFGNLTFTYGKNASNNEPMRRIPPLYGRLGMLYNFQQSFNLRVDWMFAGRQIRLSSGDINDDRIAAGGTAGWQVINLVSSLNIGNHQIKLGLQNLFNKGYRVHGSGVDGIGRSVWISLLGMISN